jgi:predicted DNA-binding transcriptional regulator AlpA
MAVPQVSHIGLRPSAVAKKLGVSVPTIWRWARLNPEFPRAYKLSPRVTLWDEGELDAFVAAAMGRTA